MTLLRLLKVWKGQVGGIIHIKLKQTTPSRKMETVLTSLMPMFRKDLSQGIP